MTPADNLIIILTIRIFPVVGRISSELRETLNLLSYKKVANLSYFAFIFEVCKTNLL